MDKLETKDKAINLFKFLRELAILRMATVRHLDKYDSVLWFKDIPDLEDCFNVYKAPHDDRGDLWIEVFQPKIPLPPAVPEILRDWVKESTLGDPDRSKPEIVTDRIIRKIVDGQLAEESTSGEKGSSAYAPSPEKKAKGKGRWASAKKISEKHKFDDDPTRGQAWEQYLADKWKPWAEKQQIHAPHIKLYKKLHEMHTRLQTLAEESELLLSLGCLAWKTPRDQKIYRHILTGRASLHFDAGRGSISVSAPLDNFALNLETDMLEIDERPKGDLKKSLDEYLNSLNKDFWNLEIANTLLQSFGRAVASESIYSADLAPLPPDEISGRATIHFAPAIVLRKRTDLNMVRLLDDMVDQVEKTGNIPTGIERLVEIRDDESFDNSKMGKESTGLVDPEIYFPLASNPDQREIADRLMTRQGVLVQGPPGTGKSHTIANLVCHLLAQGKRILVTSHTPRALTVLRDKFPEEMKALCVSTVGDDGAEARKALEESVQGITGKQNGWNQRQVDARIEELKESLHQSRESEQWLLNSLRAIRERDTYEHSKRFGDYCGTSLNIAKRLGKEQNQFSWFTDEISRDEARPLTNQQILDFVHRLQTFELEEELELRKSLVEISEIITPEDFTVLAQRIGAARIKVENLRKIRNHESFQASSKLKSAERQILVEDLDVLISLYFKIAKRPEKFAQRAAQEILGDHDRKWKELLQATQENLNAIDSNFRVIAQRHLSGAESRDIHNVHTDAIDLKDHLLNGGNFGFGPFKPAVVKRTSYLFQDVRIDGKQCNSTQSLQELIEYLNLQIKLQKIRKQWLDVTDEIPENSIAAIATFHDFCEPLADGLQLHEGMQKYVDSLKKFPALIAPDWNNPDAIKLFRQVLDSGAAQEELDDLENQLEKLTTTLRVAANNPTAHTIIERIADASAKLDDQKYHSLFEELTALSLRKEQLLLRDADMSTLTTICPQLAETLSTTDKPDLDAWKDKLANFEQAWNWKLATGWIEGLSDSNVHKRHENDLKKCQQDQRDLLKELATLKAWTYTFARLTETQRQHLTSWTMAMRRIGKGTGKYAEKHRRAAKEHMDHCRPALPAWIMPIHKVVETIRPDTDAFDVIIIDEASQSGPEALFLMYLGTQLIVVGDDKQISPDAVGLDRAAVDALRREYLTDIPHSDAIGIEHSFFDQAKIRYKGTIRLKEHFRCMPEIIQFSNNLCYSSEPLIPLRQYGGDRLNPVVRTEYLPNAYITGQRTTLVNVTEAEAILEEVKRICADPAYKGKTLGIISLVNTSQQAKYIDMQLRSSDRYVTKQDFEERKISVGDAYQFQGDERDIIILSMVSSPEEHGKVRALASEKDERRFNVAASRARDQLILFHSVTLSDLNPGCVRHKLLSYCLNPSVETVEYAGHTMPELRQILAEGYKTNSQPPQPFDSLFELDVFLRIAQRGYRVVPQVEMNGYKIDLIVEGMKGRLAVECDGDRWHGSDRFDQDSARQRDLERCGMKFWRVRGSAFYFDADHAMEDLWTTLETAGIFPMPVDDDNEQMDVGHEAVTAAG
ncbi:MAG: AAA family ATPase [Candidatus Melainabacteria bacterium]|jgi:very-short-patch-repair endonuclease|nr:AAA family ATPase [Candidatus Melainabacteria bacterium]